MLPKRENASREPSGDQVGSVAPQVNCSESAAEILGSRSRRPTPASTSTAISVRWLDFIATVYSCRTPGAAPVRWDRQRRAARSPARNYFPPRERLAPFGWRGYLGESRAPASDG